LEGKKLRNNKWYCTAESKRWTDEDAIMNCSCPPTPIDYRCEDGCFPLSASCVTISNPDSLLIRRFRPPDFSPPRIFRPQRENGCYEDFSPPRTFRPSRLKPDTSTGGFFGPSVSNLLSSMTCSSSWSH
jgi:hypothetical protein